MTTKPTPSRSDPVRRVVGIFRDDMPERFSRLLQEELSAGRCGRARELLRQRLELVASTEGYPDGLGSMAWSAVSSVSPLVRREYLRFPLVEWSLLGPLVARAEGQQVADALLLIDAVFGRQLDPQARTPVTSDRASPGGMADRVAWVIESITRDALDRRYGDPIDRAKATFLHPEVTAADAEAFNAAGRAFLRHVSARSGLLSLPDDPHLFAAELDHLINEAFAELGGRRAAEAEARRGTRGRLRFVFDTLTTHLKRQLMDRHVHRVLAEAVDPLSHDEKVAFTEALVARIGGFLPEDIRSRDPADLAEHYPALVRAYVRSIDRIGEMLQMI